MITAASILFILYSLTVLVVGFRVTKLYRDNIYKTSSRPSLKLLRKALVEADTDGDRNYVQTTMLIYQIGFIVLIAFVLVLIIYFFR